MKLLTEQKIRILMKKTNLNISKRLEVQSDTIITPSARSYINEHKIQLVIGDEVNVEPNEATSTYTYEQRHLDLFRKNELPLNLQLNKLDQMILEIIMLQKAYKQLRDLVSELDSLIQIVRELKLHILNQNSEMDFSKKKKDFYIGHSKYLKQINRNHEVHHSDSLVSIQLNKLYLDLKVGMAELIQGNEFKVEDRSKELIVWLLDYSETLIVKYKNIIS